MQLVVCIRSSQSESIASRRLAESPIDARLRPIPDLLLSLGTA